MWDTLAIPGPQQTAEYYAAGWWRTRTFIDDLAAAATSRASHPAIIAYEDSRLARTMTYAELAAMVSRFAGAFTELGIGPRDVVVCYLPNRWLLTPLYLACNLTGAVAAPVIPTLGARELAYVLTSSKAKACVTVDEFGGVDYGQRLAETAPPGLAHRIVVGDAARTGAIDFDQFFVAVPWEERHPRSGLPPASPDEPAMLVYTSGTTGQMKGVVHSQNTLQAAVRSVSEAFGLGAADVISIPHFLTHMAAATCALYMPLMLGATCVMADTNTDMGLLLDLIEAHRVSYLYAAPGYVVKLLAASRERRCDTTSLRHFVSGSAPVQPQLIASVQEEFGVALHALWGMTENGSVTVTRPEDPEGWAACSDGRPMPWMSLRIEPDIDGGEAGRLLVRGASQCLGYLGQPELYASCLDDGGWFDTGDIARPDGRGGIRICGRQADLICRASGQKVSTLEVEAVLLSHPAVDEVALVGYPDPDVPGAELVAAIVVPVELVPPSMADLRAYLADAGVATVLWPDRLMFARVLPKNSLGKLERGLLRKRLEIAAAGQPSAGQPSAGRP